jgi:16S rRNA (cytosine967-C5)-methyltransferase
MRPGRGGRNPGAARPGSPPTPSPVTARGVALQALRRVVEGEGYSNLVVPALLGRSGLEPRDRAFAAELAYGTIRHLRSLDWAIEQRADRPVDRMSPGARDPLRLGAYQLLFAKVAPHAAVGETVGLAGPRERGYVNAVLRKLAQDPPDWPPQDDDDALAVRTGLQPWAVGELRRVLPDPAEVEIAAEAFAERGFLSLRTNRCATTPEALDAALRAAGHTPTRSAVHPDCLLLDGGDPTTFPHWDEGWFAVQDQASAFVVAALDVHPGHRVLDACAGPGGKTAHMTCLAGDGLVVAADLHPQRADLVRSGAARLGLHPRVVAADATVPALRGVFDRVLVDAPCSGIGAARRRPELLWRPRKDELSRLARLQVAIAVASSDLLAPGGRLVYSVCTFPRAETDAACDAIVRHRPDLEPAPVQGPDGAAPRVRLWPHRNGSDGMFVAAFTKTT